MVFCVAAAMKTNDCIHLLKALADETRWCIVRELLAESCTVNDLVARIAVSQYNVSKHLRILREAGIVQAERHGRNVECRIVPAFRLRLSQNRNQLDLGCCVFKFDAVTK